jgi:hypothetical protein
MSASAFIDAIRDPDYDKWLKNSKSNNIILKSVNEMRKGEQVAEKTSFLLDTKKIKEIATSISATSISDEDVLDIFHDAIDAINTVHREIIHGNTILFENVSFGQISSILEKAFSSLKVRKTIQDKQSGDFREKRISDTFQAGHVFSIAANVTDQTIQDIQNAGMPEKVKVELLRILNNMATKLKEEDLKTSNLKSLDYDIYAKYSKDPYNYLVEMQFEDINRDSGTASAPIINAIKRYLTPKNYVSFNKFFKERADKDSFIIKLLETKGSPSYIDLLTNNIVSSMEGKPASTNKPYSIPKTKIGTLKSTIDSSNVSKNIKKQVANVNKAVATVKSIPTKAIRTTNGQFYSLANLQMLLNAQLQDVISANMGNGNAKNILNYRTGRFAASVRVERLTQSREGMITAFYQYQKNPYQTFEPGFAQGSPKTRDPKLLISKSIREIAATKVENRLRAVLI